MSPRANPPRLAPASMSIKELCRLYRILDNLEETANMAHQYVCHVDRQSAVSGYVNDLQEYLSEERSAIVDALRSLPATDDKDGDSRISVIVQYDAWCEDFPKATIQQFVTSKMAREAY